MQLETRNNHTVFQWFFEGWLGGMKGRGGVAFTTEEQIRAEIARC